MTRDIENVLYTELYANADGSIDRGSNVYLQMKNGFKLKVGSQRDYKIPFVKNLMVRSLLIRIILR